MASKEKRILKERWYQLVAAGGLKENKKMR